MEKYGDKIISSVSLIHDDHPNFITIYFFRLFNDTYNIRAHKIDFFIILASVCFQSYNLHEVGRM